MPQPVPLFCPGAPGVGGGIIDLTSVPWMAMLRHSSALLFYILALVQWPGRIVNEWAASDRVYAYNLSSLMFTLMFWSACLYHYMVSAGRVSVCWRTGRVRAVGWIVRTSRRAHRVILSLSLAVAALSVVHPTIMEATLHAFYLRDNQFVYREPTPGQHTLLIMLKVDQTIAFFLFVLILFRLVFEPIGVRKRVRRAERKSDDTREMEKAVPEQWEECAICVEKAANRQLPCGHMLCCCCLGEIWKASFPQPSRCPFCRESVDKARALKVVEVGVVRVTDCCSLDPEEVRAREDEAMDREEEREEREELGAATSRTDDADRLV